MGDGGAIPQWRKKSLVLAEAVRVLQRLFPVAGPTLGPVKVDGVVADETTGWRRQRQEER